MHALLRHSLSLFMLHNIASIPSPPVFTRESMRRADGQCDYLFAIPCSKSKSVRGLSTFASSNYTQTLSSMVPWYTSGRITRPAPDDVDGHVGVLDRVFLLGCLEDECGSGCRLLRHGGQAHYLILVLRSSYTKRRVDGHEHDLALATVTCRHKA